MSSRDDRLRQEVRSLGEQLGEVMSRIDGESTFELEERIRALSKARRQGESGAEQELIDIIRELDLAQAWSVCRAFTIFFDLANLAEDRHRVRILREREQQLQLRKESIRDAVLGLKARDVSAEQVQALLNGLSIEPVFTAHPTEAKRRAVRGTLRRIRKLLDELDAHGQLDRHRERLQSRLREELSALWETDLLRPRKPTVLEEVERGLFFMHTLWRVVPELFADLRLALEEAYPQASFDIPPFLQFGSWMGGDRDGNPYVTASVTARTLMRQRQTALRRHLNRCRQAFKALTQSEVRVYASAALKEALEDATWRWPQLKSRLEPISPNEVYRRWLRVIRWRLGQSLKALHLGGETPGHYRTGTQLYQDLELLRDSLAEHRGAAAHHELVDGWLEQTRIFGLHMARLDVRQEAGAYHHVIAEISSRLELCPDYLAKDENGRREFLRSTLDRSLPVRELTGTSAMTAETLSLLRQLKRAAKSYGRECLGCHVLSMTHQVSDVLAVLWLARHAAGDLELPIVPLFETIADLERGPQILSGMLTDPVYREYLARAGQRQIVMVGYSDSTKDGGYLAANAWLYQAQYQMQKVAREAGVHLVLFHGRGGSLGRGGGPAARSILSLPPEVAREGLRVTEQGEVLSERYDDPQVAYRHLEQLTWAMMFVRSTEPVPPQPGWLEALKRLGERALASYRELVELPGFVEYFQTATPVEGIELLQIGSRPSRRRASASLEGLRAIPWVFAWTQSRAILPAWYGLGTAFEAENQEVLLSLYREWSFFQAVVDNAALALAKADMGIAYQYSRLVEDQNIRDPIWTRLEKEYERSRQAILRLTGESELLERVPWLQRSIKIRNPYVDPLNLIQVEVFRRLRTPGISLAEQEAYQSLLRMTIQGVAGGLRTTG